MNTYDDVGHLSPESEATVKAVRAHCLTHIDLFDRTNRLSMRLLQGELRRGGPDPFNKTLAALVGTFVAIVIRRCQAAVMVAERGLGSEADTLTRSALEHAFVLGSLLSDPQRCLVDLDADDIHHKRRLLGLINERSDIREALSTGALESFERSRAAYVDLPKGVGLHLKEHAEHAGYGFEYRSLYAVLSMSSAHPTNTVLREHSTWTSTRPQVEFGPDVDMGLHIDHATAVLLMSMKRVCETYGLSDALAAIETLSDEHGRLQEKA